MATAPCDVFLCSSGGLGWQQTRTLLEQVSDVRIVGDAPAGPAALQALAALSAPPDLILAAADVKDMDAAAFHQKLVRQYPGSRIAAFSATYSPDLDVLRRQLGVATYEQWDELELAELASVLQLLIRGHAVEGPAASVAALPVPPAASSGAMLSASSPAVEVVAEDLAILRGIVAGRTHELIGRDIGMSARTLEHRLERLQQRFGVESAAGVIMQATLQGNLP